MSFKTHAVIIHGHNGRTATVLLTGMDVNLPSDNSKPLHMAHWKRSSSSKDPSPLNVAAADMTGADKILMD